MKSKSALPILNAAIALGLSALIGFTATTFAQAQSTASATSTTAAKKTIQGAQERLQALGYQPGSTDGLMGAKTTAALKKFQSDHGLSASGLLDHKTIGALSAEKKSGTSSAPETSPAAPAEVKTTTPALANSPL